MYQNNNIRMMKKQKIKGGKEREENERKRILKISPSSPQSPTHTTNTTQLNSTQLNFAPSPTTISDHY
jgi:hypothetical protein